METVAAARRQLPGGVVPEDCVLQVPGVDGTPTDLRLSELFTPGKDSLVIYTFSASEKSGRQESATAPSWCDAPVDTSSYASPSSHASSRETFRKHRTLRSVPNWYDRNCATTTRRIHRTTARRTKAMRRNGVVPIRLGRTQRTTTTDTLVPRGSCLPAVGREDRT